MNLSLSLSGLERCRVRLTIKETGCAKFSLSFPIQNLTYVENVCNNKIPQICNAHSLTFIFLYLLTYVEITITIVSP